MTKEQEEAIENLTKLLKQRDEKQVKITTYNLFENIETVLFMLKQNSAEIENYKSLYNKALKDLVKVDRENIQLKKQINLMAEELVKAHEYFYSEFDNFTKVDFIKYFERKVKDEN